MMQNGQWNSNQMHGQCGCNKMHGQCSCHQMRPSHQMQPVVCPTQFRCHDQFIPREVPFIHPIVNINRQHTVIVPRHYVSETTRNVPGSTVSPAGGQQPGGGFGPGFGMGPQSGGFGPGYGMGPQSGGNRGFGGCGRRGC